MPRSRTARHPLAGTTAVISGAASGIGRATAQRLSRAGCPVAITDVNEEGLQDTASSLDGPVLHQVLDVRDRQAQMAWAATVREWAPAPLGMVFNNAGVAVAQSVADAHPEDDEWLLQINLYGVVHGTRAFLPILLEQGSGAIVNTSSVFGLVGIPLQSAYCASKFAVRGYTDSLRQELRGTGVRAACVHPGGVRTNIVASGRIHADPQGQGRDREALAREFAAMAQTTPEQAAAIIQRGVEAGRARILVGPDAYLFDAMARLAPTRYYDIMERFEPLVRAQVKRRLRRQG
jgi:NADP-dependent 3-hydroxy acid dehydrogenase YdfG